MLHILPRKIGERIALAPCLAARILGCNGWVRMPFVPGAKALRCPRQQGDERAISDATESQKAR